MATTSPARIDDDLYASAKLAGEVQSRSASQQVVHWARIGREIEASASISHKDIAEVLAGSQSYDKLSAKEQAVVRAEWSVRMDGLREALNLAAQFAAAGRTWVELDDDGNIVERGDVTADVATGRQIVEGGQAAARGRSGRGRKVVKSGTTNKGVAEGGKSSAEFKRKKASGRGAGAHSAG
jgi:hypothetical protein